MHVLVRTFISLLYCPTGRNPDKPHKKRTRFRGGNLYLLFFIGYWKRRRSLAAVIFLGSFCFLLLFIMLACYIPPVSDFYLPLLPHHSVVLHLLTLFSLLSCWISYTGPPTRKEHNFFGLLQMSLHVRLVSYPFHVPTFLDLHFFIIPHFPFLFLQRT